MLHWYWLVLIGAGLWFTHLLAFALGCAWRGIGDRNKECDQMHEAYAHQLGDAIDAEFRRQEIMESQAAGLLSTVQTGDGF